MKDDKLERSLAPDRTLKVQHSTFHTSTVSTATSSSVVNEPPWHHPDLAFGAEQQLNWHQRSEQVLSDIAQASQQIPGLKGFFQQVVQDVRQLLRADRVCIYRFDNDWHGDRNSAALAESVQSTFPSMLGIPIRDLVLSGCEALQLYQQGKPYVMSNLTSSHAMAISLLESSTLSAAGIENTCSALNPPIDPTTVHLLESFRIQAQLAVPIFRDQELWGLLVVHQCTTPRLWQVFEVQFCQRAAVQIELAIERAHLRRQIRQLHANSAFQTQHHANRLQQTLDFEAMLQRITDRVRDSLDETTILYIAVQELATVLKVSCCQAVLCDLGSAVARSRSWPEDSDSGTLTGCGGSHEYVTFPDTGDNWIHINELPGLWQQLHRGLFCQFCLMLDVLQQGGMALLTCPIFDDQGYLGNLRLYAQSSHIFDDQEIRLVQQVASHCAIAIRQARLYQAAQAQVRELERLHQLKNDFLSTVSHELRTPLSSIKMVTNLLKLALAQPEVLTPSKPLLEPQVGKVTQYLKVLEDECDREINLVNDLLATQHLDAGVHPLSLSTIHLQDWLPHIADSFSHRVRMNQQTLSLQIAPNLPPLVSDTFMLNRIVIELLNNACKYTPADGEIKILAQPVDPEPEPDAPSDQQPTQLSLLPLIQIQVINTGVEIALEELPRIFDPFYRIPSSDPWKRSGTGLGLSLTRKLVKYLGGKIQVDSQPNQVAFTVVFSGQESVPTGAERLKDEA